MMDDFGDNQTVDKSLEEVKTAKMSFVAYVKVGEDASVFQADIAFLPIIPAIFLHETPTPNNFSLRQLIILAQDIATYYSENDSMSICFKPEVNKLIHLLTFETAELRKEFELEYRTFMGYSNPEKVNE